MTLSKTTTEWIFISILCVFLFLSVALFPQSPDSEAYEYRLEPPDPAWVDKTLDSMTLREKIGQLIQIRVQGKFVNRQDDAFKELKGKIAQYNIGGVVLFAGNIYESALLLNELQSYSKVPLLVSADF